MIISNVSYKEFIEGKKKKKKCQNKVNNNCDVFIVIYDLTIQCDYIRNLNKKGNKRKKESEIWLPTNVM